MCIFIIVLYIAVSLDTKTMNKNQINTLAQIAAVDGQIAEKELRFIRMIGSVNGMTQEEVDIIVADPEPMEDLPTLSDDQKFEYLYSVVQLMKADGQVFKSEINFCENLAERLGSKKGVIGALSSRLYSDPSIAGDRQSLKYTTDKYKA